MNRRDFIAGAAAGAAGASLGGSSAADTSRPNVLLILCDQMRNERWIDRIETPNLDRIAARGVSFSNHFVAATPCSPSRACLFTGTHTTQNGMHLNCDFTEGDRQPSLTTELPTLGHVFQRAGYRTPYRGKWHLSRGKDRRWKLDKLSDYGFEGWVPPDSPFGGPPYSGAVQDPAYAGQAAEWIRRNGSGEEPWFMTLSLVNPHDVASFPRFYPQARLQDIRTGKLPDNWKDDLSGKPGAQREYRELYAKLGGPIGLDDEEMWKRYLDFYAHCVEDMDGNAGRVLDALEESGASDNTIVVFTSDHGEMAGSHGLRGKDTFVYEEKMKVPLIVSAPGILPKGKECGAMSSNVDVFPTILGLARINHGGYTAGEDLTPVLLGQKKELHDYVILHHDSEIRTPTTIGGKAKSNFKHPTHIRSLRTGEYKYAYYFRPGRDEREYELYDLTEDPLELHNLADDAGYTAKRRELHDLLAEEDRRLLAEFNSR